MSKEIYEHEHVHRPEHEYQYDKEHDLGYENTGEGRRTERHKGYQPISRSDSPVEEQIKPPPKKP